MDSQKNYMKQLNVGMKETWRGLKEMKQKATAKMKEAQDLLYSQDMTSFSIKKKDQTVKPAPFHQSQTV